MYGSVQNLTLGDRNMINDSKEIKELLDTFKEVPRQIIKKAIKEVLAENKEKGEQDVKNKRTVQI